jgi:hypothetical protein
LPDTLSFTICDNERFNLDLTAQLGLDREFRWIPIENSSVRGASPGKGRTFSGTFTIFQQDISQKQYFQLYSINALGCRSNFAILELDIKFNPYVQFSAQGSYCEGDTVSILLEGFLSEHPLQVEYQFDGINGILTLDENNQFVFKALAEKVSTFEIASIFNDFCSSNESIDRIFITLHPKESTPLSFRQCKGTPIIVNGTNYILPGLYYDTLSTTQGCDSLLIIEIALDSLVTGNHYFFELCHGETLTLFSKEYNSTGMFTDTVSIKGSCDSIHTLDVKIYDPIALAGSVIINDSGQGDGAISLDLSGGKPPYSFLWSHGSTGSFVSELGAGAYRVTVTDDLGCTAFFGFEVMQVTQQWSANPSTSFLDVYPNPVQRGETLYFSFEQALSTQPKVAVLTAQGQVLNNFLLTPGLSPFVWQWEVPPHLSPGFYGLLISSEKGGTWFKNCVVK